MNSRMALRMITLAGLAALSTAACSSTTSTPLGSSRPDPAQQQRDLHGGGRYVFGWDVRARGRHPDRTADV